MTDLPKSRSKRRLTANRTDTQNPIVPAGDVTGKALTIVIAIMTFLACLALGSVNLVQEQAKNWESQISREATIQIRPQDGLVMDTTLKQAADLVKTFPGVKNAEIIDKDATYRLLEPWLGSGLELDDLPIPRLVIVTLDEQQMPDFSTISAAIAKQIPGASFDDHRNWVDRLVTMARASVLTGLTIFFLVLSALTLTVVFATRGALAGNAHIVEVLHFIGAQSRFIARQFDIHFFKTGLKGASIGGLAAIIIFFIFSIWSSRNMATPEADQAAALFGNFSINMTTYIEIVILTVCVGMLTMLTSRLTIIRMLRDIDRHQSDLF